MSYFLAMFVGALVAALGIAISRKLDIERQLFSYSLILGAFWYVGFGIFDSTDPITLISHSIAALFFAGLGILGLKKSIGFTALGWACHIIWDYSAHLFGNVPGPWWTAPTCLGFDPVVAVYIAARMKGHLQLET